ncbi:MAG TPA: amidase [Microthrixaceae bacterium]|nr:amidase [Microthrixaceae bacterium]
MVERLAGLAHLAGRVRDGAVSPTELVQESLRRIEASHADLNAVVSVDADRALDEAAGHPRTGALAGLPLLVKDMARCRGSRTTFGSPLFVDAPPDEIDDIVVARLRAAGAIVVGRTNTPAFGHAPFTTNVVFGPTRNPWNLERSPGGSSGGSTAALIAGLAPLATASDGGGSVRIPSSCCGLVGYKPTMGAIGRNVLPRWLEFSTQGVAGRTVADVVHEANVTLGAAPGDWVSVPAGTVDPEPTMPRMVFTCRSFRADVDPVVEAAVVAAVQSLAADGVEVVEVDPPSDPGSVFDWFVMSSAELAQSLGDVRDQWEAFEPSLAAMLTFGEQVSAADYIAAQRRRHEIGARIDAVVGSDAVLVLPTLNVRSWAPEGPVPSDAGSVVDDPTIATNTPELNATGHPAVSVPVGFDEAGVPIGMQVVAPRFRDGLALGVAARLEQIRPWPTVAGGYEPFPGLS